MANATADRNLLFGILAVQMEFISRDALIVAMNAWVLAKAKALGQILVEQKALTPDRHALLDALVQEHLKAHGNDAGKSLAAAGYAGPVREALQQVADVDIHASLAYLPVDQAALGTVVPVDADIHASRAYLPGPGRTKSDAVAGRTGGDQFATRAPSVGPTTSSGLRFRILRPHAKGGLGEVLVAEDAELHREVALKHIQDPLADHPENRARFLLEAEITGGLEHPGVVPVYGLGQYVDGRPFYAMRFIRGDSLRDVIKRFHKAEGQAPGERTLQLHQLLNRFIDVCNAMAYAHSRGVLHRDLKPANIMLGQYGETLIVDWGLAKVLGQAGPDSLMPALAPHSSGTSDATMPGQLIGTPVYMAPEQAQGRLDLINERTDIYGLGAVLFEILTGRVPHPGQEVQDSLNDALQNPTPRARAVTPSLQPALDAVCAKAMAKNPGDRYRSALELASDVQRFLADEPVSAWREPWRIRARRWLARRRTLVTAAAATILATTIVLAVTTVLLQRANTREKQAREREQQARELAEHNFQIAHAAVDRYFTEVSENVLLHEPGMEPLRKKLLEAARDFYDQFVRERSNDPAARGDLGKGLFRLALITEEIDSKPHAIDLHRQAVEILKALVTDHPDRAEYQTDLAGCFHHLGRLYRLTDQPSQAEDAYQKALALWEPLAEAHPQEAGYQASLAKSQLGLGNVYQVTRKMDQAVDEYEKALAIRKTLTQAHPQDPDYQRDLSISYHNLAMVYEGLGREGKAETAYRESLEIQEELVKDNPLIQQYENDLARTHCNLADLYARQERFDEAVVHYQRAARDWKSLTETHGAVMDNWRNLAEADAGLASVYCAASQISLAEEPCRQALEILKKQADDHPDLPRCAGDLARSYSLFGKVYAAEGQSDKAQASYQEACRIQEKLAGQYPDAPHYQGDLARIYNELGLFCQDHGKGPQAVDAFHKALALWEALAKSHPAELEFIIGEATGYYNLGNQAQADGQLQAALQLYNQALETLKPVNPDLPTRSDAQKTCRNIYWKLAQVMTRLAHYSLALQDWDRAIKLSPESELVSFRLYRSMTVAQSGEHVKAAAEAKQIAEGVPVLKETFYDLACVYALCLAAAVKDAGLPQEQRQKLAEGYALQALGYLREAQEAGYFQTPVNLAKVTTDLALQSLWPRADFKSWLNSGQPKSQAPGKAR